MIFPEGDDVDDDDDDDATARCFCSLISYINLIMLYAYTQTCLGSKVFISLHRLQEYQLVVYKSFWTGLATLPSPLWPNCWSFIYVQSLQGIKLKKK